jgi:rhodanese-related sulfurtransferase
MKNNKYLILYAIVTLVVSVLVQTNTHSVRAESQVSGRIVNGLRILTVESSNKQADFTVYRGDYIKFEFDRSMGDPILSIPALSVSKTLSGDFEKSPYFKMKQNGTFAYSLGNTSGHITIIAYQQEHYREVTSQQAASLITASQPLILDVRTPKEFKAGHLKNAVLIPVQNLKGRLSEIADFKNQKVLVYCATGNRSTVASKILNDAGFKYVSNLRYGIYQWAKDKNPIIR